MKTKTANLAPIERPFPNAKQSKELDKEDAFMEEYGGLGPATIYRLTVILSNFFGRKGQM